MPFGASSIIKQQINKPQQYICPRRETQLLIPITGDTDGSTKIYVLVLVKTRWRYENILLYYVNEILKNILSQYHIL